MGYEHLQNQLVTHLGDTPLTSLRQMVALVEANTAPYLSFMMQPHSERVVLEVSNLKAATSEILHSHQIPADRSGDLLAASGEASASRSGAASSAPGRKGKRAR